MLLIAPERLGHVADQAYMRLQDLRDRFDDPNVNTGPEWSLAQSALGEALDALRTAMRSDLTSG